MKVGGKAVKAHRIAQPRRDESGPGLEVGTAQMEKRGDDQSALSPAIPRRVPRVSKRVIAILVVVSIIVASGVVAWALYFRHWSMSELERMVIADPTLDTPGFKHSLAGKTITVEGRVSSTESYNTTLGPIHQVWLKGADNISLIVRGALEYGVGDKVVMDVRFDWATINEERHVYSHQIDFPWLQLAWYGEVLESVSDVRGTLLIPEPTAGNGTIRFVVFDQRPALRVSEANCTFSEGRTSWWAEYADAFKGWGYGELLDSIPNLAQPTSINNMLRFSDADSDGYVSSGDSFDVSGIYAPSEMADVQAYKLVVGFTNGSWEAEGSFTGMSYVLMTHEGLLRIEPEQPYARMAVSVTNYTAVGTFTKISKQVKWDNVTVMLNTPSYQTLEWTPNSAGLGNGAPSELDLGIQTSGGVSLGCAVMDREGNGLMDAGDSVVFTSYDAALSKTSNYTLVILYEPTGAGITSANFHG